MYKYVAPNTTFCEDTPENWAEFERLKARLQERQYGGGGGYHAKTDAERFNERLQAKTGGENKRFRELRHYLPGHEPDNPSTST